MGIVSFLRRKVGKSREPVFERRHPLPQLLNNFNFHAKFAGCGPIVAFPPRIERRFRVEKWPRVSRREGGKVNFSLFFFYYTRSLYSYFIIQIFSVILSLLQCLFLNISKSNRGFCERGCLNQVLVLNVFFFFF